MVRHQNPVKLKKLRLISDSNYSHNYIFDFVVKIAMEKKNSNSCLEQLKIENRDIAKAGLQSKIR